MAHNKPFHRNARGMIEGQNAGYSGWAFIEDREYAQNPEHYIRALILIQNDLQSIFEFVEPADESKTAFSYRIHALLMRTCIEIEANFKAILDENIFTRPSGRSLNIRDYRKIDVTHHLSSYEAVLPIWNGTSPSIKPFEPWFAFRGQSAPNGGVTLPWYRAYNASKHDRQQEFKEANLWNLIQAVSALLIVVSAQFKTVTFDAGPDHIIMGSGTYHPYQHSIGSLFRIKVPSDWAEDESYDFNWSELKNEPVRFQKIDYDSIIS